MPPLLRADDVCFAYGGNAVLTDVSFAVARGEVLGVIGPNGAGKSTLLALTMGLLRPQQGTFRLGETRIDGRATPSLAGLGLARTFQRPRVFGSLSVLDNMLVSPRTRAAARDGASNVDRLLDTVGLTAYRSTRAGELSVGQQKLLDLARALATRPSVLLLDEVTAGVHPSLIPRISEAIEGHVAEGGGAMLVTHELDVARRSCSRLLALHNGRVVAEGTPEVVLREERVIEAYLGA